MTSVSSSFGYLTSNTKVQNFRVFQVVDTYRDIEYILKNFWTSSNISSSVKQSYLEFLISKIGVLYMVRNIKKLATTFIQTTFPNYVVRLLKNRIQPKLLQILDCAETST